MTNKVRKIVLKSKFLIGLTVLVVAAVVPGLLGAVQTSAMEQSQYTQTQSQQAEQMKQAQAKLEAAKKAERLRLNTAKPAGGDRMTEASAKLSGDSENQREKLKQKLDDTKLKICQKRQQLITTQLRRIAERGQKQITLFDTTAKRVEKFYADKGKTLENYDELVASVNTKKAAAQAAVDAIKVKSSGFSCSGDDPKGFVGAFKDSLKSEITALKEYRAAVKSLIVGVKSVQEKPKGEVKVEMKDTVKTEGQQ